mgnify:CR=1 FL=1
MNYMDYSDDNCTVMFTEGQKTRMLAGLNTVNPGLITSAAANCAPVNVNDFSLSDKISVYPNPSTGDVFINVGLSNMNSIDVTLFNAIGEAVISKKINMPSNNEIKLDLNNKPDGIYLLEIETSEGNRTKKIIINR